jgi:hypothetical protein
MVDTLVLEASENVRESSNLSTRIK